jgi:hypothetical protein
MSEYLLAEFKTRDDIAAAARRAADAGKPAEDALTQIPVEGIADCLARPRNEGPIGWVMFVAGVVGAIFGYGIQWYSSVIDYPIDSGGRPLNSWPAFMLVPYEAAILFAAVIGILAWMWMCGLPKLFHPLFDSDAVERAVQDGYLLVFPRTENLESWIETDLKPSAIHEVHE